MVWDRTNMFYSRNLLYNNAVEIKRIFSICWADLWVTLASALARHIELMCECFLLSCSISFQEVTDGKIFQNLEFSAICSSCSEDGWESGNWCWRKVPGCTHQAHNGGDTYLKVKQLGHWQMGLLSEDVLFKIQSRVWKCLKCLKTRRRHVPHSVIVKTLK